MRLKKAVILLLLFSLFLSQPLFAQDSKAADSQNPAEALRSRVDNFISNLGIYNHIIKYIRQEKDKNKAVVLKPVQFIVLFAIDLILSLFCLWLTIFFLTCTKSLLVKPYIWFLFIWNIIFALQLIFFRGAWRFLEFVLVRLRPELTPGILEHFPIALISVGILLYIWLLARTFGFNFYGALGTLFFSHLIYFLLIFLVLILTVKLDTRDLSSAIGQSLGVRNCINGYLADSENITGNKYILHLFRIKAFHL